MRRQSVRLGLLAGLSAVLVSGCVALGGTIQAVSTPHIVPRPPRAATLAPAAQPTTRPTQPAPTAQPSPAAGPPFPDREPGVVIVDLADEFSAETEELATRRIAGIATEYGANVVVFTQTKPGSDAASTKRDAVALKLKWRVTDAVVIMWNATRRGCLPGAFDNEQVQLYSDTRFSATRLSALKRQRIFDELMLPFLRDCKPDDALLAALDGIATDLRAPVADSSAQPTTAKGACADPAFELSGTRWEETFEWSFEESSVPDEYDVDDVLEVVTRSAENITSARNDCGLPDKIGATARYAGTTTEPPCESERSDGVNSVGFAPLPEDVEPDTLAFVCRYGDDDDIVEADILINTEIAWALSEDECERFEELLEATLTHEFGHVFGLSHVSEERHADLTMSPMSNGPCDASEITLGLGDVLGLEELY